MVEVTVDEHVRSVCHRLSGRSWTTDRWLSFSTNHSQSLCPSHSPFVQELCSRYAWLSHMFGSWWLNFPANRSLCPSHSPFHAPMRKPHVWELITNFFKSIFGIIVQFSTVRIRPFPRSEVCWSHLHVLYPPVNRALSRDYISQDHFQSA